MDDAPNIPPDPIENFLQAHFSASGHVPFRQALLARTSKVLRRRRWKRRLVLAAGLAACFLAGIATMRLWPADTPDPSESEKNEDRIVSRGKPAVAPVPRPAAGQASLPAAVAKEWQAFDDLTSRSEFYRQAGDLYINENHDYESALRCYSQALDSAVDRDLSISPADSWLLMALKEARQKEKRHAPKDG